MGKLNKIGSRNEFKCYNRNAGCSKEDRIFYAKMLYPNSNPLDFLCDGSNVYDCDANECSRRLAEKRKKEVK